MRAHDTSHPAVFPHHHHRPSRQLEHPRQIARRAPPPDGFDGPATGAPRRPALERWGAVVHNVTQGGVGFPDERGTPDAPIRVGRRVTIDTTPHVRRGLGVNGGSEQPKDQQDPAGPTFRLVSGPEGSNPRHHANPYLIQFKPQRPGTYVFEVASRNGEGAPARISIVVA